MDVSTIIGGLKLARDVIGDVTRLRWKRSKRAIGSDPVRIVLDTSEGFPECRLNAIRGERVVELHARWCFTNASRTWRRIVRGYTERPRSEGVVLVEPPGGGFYSREQDLLPTFTQSGISRFLVLDEIWLDEDIECTVVFIDNYGAEYRIPKVRFLRPAAT